MIQKDIRQGLCLYTAVNWELRGETASAFRSTDRERPTSLYEEEEQWPRMRLP